MRSEKKYMVQSITESISDSDFCYLVSYAGIKVQDFSAFRDQLGAAGARCTVQKHALIKKAADAMSIAGLDAVDLTQSTAIVYGKGDCSAVAKIINEFGKKNETVKAKGGYLDSSVLGAADVAALADLPTKPVLQAMLLGLMQAPARNLVTVLNAKAATIVNVINAYKDKVQNAN
jgi:large subunit ribosomal protein L10